MVPLARPVAKRDLAVGDTLDQIGEYTYRAWVMTVPEARAAGALPCGLIAGAKVTQSIAKGSDVGRMFADYFGKETCYCHGRGGSMHIADVMTGNVGANGIVGGGLPIAVGAALSAKRLGKSDVTLCFFGDGADNEGAFHESLNMAAVWKLPVIFVCENNGYGMSTSTARSTAVPRIAERTSAYAMPGVTVDGNDLSAIARVGKGPLSSRTPPIAGAAIPNPTATAIAPQKRSRLGSPAPRSAASPPNSSPMGSSTKRAPLPSKPPRPWPKASTSPRPAPPPPPPMSPAMSMPRPGKERHV